MPVKYLVAVLALAAATGLTAAYLHRLFTRSEPLLSWEDALELRRALNAGRVSLTFSAHVRELPLTVNLTLDNKRYVLQLRRVLIYFRARDAPVFEEPSMQLWRAWGNGTHAGAVSALDVSDDGYTIYIKYLALKPGTPAKGSSFCLGQGVEDTSYGFLFDPQIQASGRIEVPGESYQWTGRRVVKVVRVEVGPCGG